LREHLVFTGIHIALVLVFTGSIDLFSVAIAEYLSLGNLLRKEVYLGS
jgi:hypothetical protein